MFGGCRDGAEGNSSIGGHMNEIVCPSNILGNRMDEAGGYIPTCWAVMG